MTLWDEVFAGSPSTIPTFETEQWLVDAMAARFVLRPESLDVVVGSNLFGDILSDLGSAIAGSLGIAASANIDPERRNPSMFEPVHGSAPDIAGQGIANPIGQIWSAALMLDHLGLPDQAARIVRAIEHTTRHGQTTPDLGGTANTSRGWGRDHRRRSAKRPKPANDVDIRLGGRVDHVGVGVAGEESTSGRVPALKSPRIPLDHARRLAGC